MIDIADQSINPDPEQLLCNACGFETKEATPIYWYGCIECMGECE